LVAKIEELKRFACAELDAGAEEKTEDRDAEYIRRATQL